MGNENIIETSKYEKLRDISDFIFAMLGNGEVIDDALQIDVINEKNTDIKEENKKIDNRIRNESDDDIKTELEEIVENNNAKINENNYEIRTLTNGIVKKVNAIPEDKINKENICFAAVVDLRYVIFEHEKLSTDKIIESYQNHLSSIKQVLLGDISQDPKLKNNIFSKLLNMKGKKLSDEKRKEINNIKLDKKEIIHNFQQSLRKVDLEEFFQEQKAKSLGLQYITKIENKEKQEYVVSSKLVKENIAEYAKSLRQMKKILDTRTEKDKLSVEKHNARMEVFNRAKEELISRGVSRKYLESYLNAGDWNANIRLNRMIRRSKKEIAKYNERNEKLMADLKVKEDKAKKTDKELIKEEKEFDKEHNIVNSIEDPGYIKIDEDFIIEKDKTSDVEKIDFLDDELEFKSGEIVSVSDDEFEEFAVGVVNSKDEFIISDEKQKEDLEFDELSN